MPDWILTVTILFAVTGVLAVLAPLWLRIRKTHRPTARVTPRKRPPKEPPLPPPLVSLECPICQAQLGFSSADFRRLTAPEVALIVSQRRYATRRSLLEATCPRCDACFTFYGDVNPPSLLGTNLYHAQQKGNRCVNCAKPLTRPTWDSEEITTREQVLDALDPLHGLDCEHCGAVCCAGCCEHISRNRTTDGSLMCPRCRRKSMHLLHYF